MAQDRERLLKILVKEHEPSLRAFARAFLFDRAAADDVVQETFLAAWRQLDEYDEAIPFAHWLRGIARNKIRAHNRKQAIASKHVRLLTHEQINAVADEFERLVPGRGGAFDDTLEALQACLRALSPDDHEVICRVYEKNQTGKAIAEDLGRTLDAIKQRVQRARLRLRDCILGKLRSEVANV